MKIEIVQVTDRKLDKAFFRLPLRIYREDPFWVPLSARIQQKIINGRKNPALQSSHVEYAKFLALRGREPLGRILVCQHTDYARQSGEDGAFLGCFECVEDEQVASLFFHSAEKWAQLRNLNALYGPFFTLPGFEGGLPANDQPRPYALTQIYAPLYYAALFRFVGFVPVRSIHTYIKQNPAAALPYLKSFERVRQRRNASERYAVRPLKTQRLMEELERIRVIANDAFTGYPFFPPMTPEQIRFNFSGLDRILAKDLSFIIEDQGRAVGFILTLYNFHPALLELRNKPLLYRILGSIRILKNLESCKEFVILLIAFTKDVQGKAIPELASWYSERIRSTKPKALYTSFVHQQNHASSNIAVRAFGMEIDHTYVIYKKVL
uniref:N-acetyltransferase domain-containing protein n=1 Tax=Candidatus Kentrum sp. TUN TaxID=2126343 RepID=A0A451A3Q7_9GAMM|nr:MAG: hypothetical protein BECKTUN1418D_GA0071000_11315 [Candidatus Kentron sp. TUN]